MLPDLLNDNYLTDIISINAQRTNEIINARENSQKRTRDLKI